jgi:hypothetical protein
MLRWVFLVVELDCIGCSDGSMSQNGLIGSTGVEHLSGCAALRDP